MASAEIQRLSNDVANMKKEMMTTGEALERIQSEGNIWTESGRQAIIEKCLPIVMPKLKANVDTLVNATARLEKLWADDEAKSIWNDLKKILQEVKDGLEKIVKYGKEPPAIVQLSLNTVIASLESVKKTIARS